MHSVLLSKQQYLWRWILFVPVWIWKGNIKQESYIFIKLKHLITHTYCCYISFLYRLFQKWYKHDAWITIPCHFSNIPTLRRPSVWNYCSECKRQDWEICLTIYSPLKLTLRIYTSIEIMKLILIWGSNSVRQSENLFMAMIFSTKATWGSLREL